MTIASTLFKLPHRAALLATVAAAALLCTPLLADDVHLTNGGVFEEVVTRTTPTHVIIEMAIGKLTLPLEQVSKVVLADTPIAEFRRRHEALLEDPTSRAADWLLLARWGLAHGLQAQSGQSALFAARLDPNLEGLEPILSGLGYDNVENVGWLPRDQAMRLQGKVLYDGRWLTPTERATHIASDRQRPQPSTTRNEGGGDAVALASIKLAEKALDQGERSARRTEERADRSQRTNQGHGFGGGYRVYGGAVAIGQRFASPEEAAAYSERVRQDLRALANRPPGSIIPLQPSSGSSSQRTGVFGPQQ